MSKPIAIATIAASCAAFALGCNRSESPTLGVQVDSTRVAPPPQSADPQSSDTKTIDKMASDTKANGAQAPLRDKPSADAGSDAKPANAANANPDATATGVKSVEVVHQAPLQVAQGGDGRARNITFDAFKFPMDDPKSRVFERKMLTESIEKLVGQRIRIRGFILPGALDEFSHFVLVRDNQQCCFGPGAALYDSMMVDLEDGSTNFVTRPITVEGTFEVREIVGPDKKHWSIYHLKATKVE